MKVTKEGAIHISASMLSTLVVVLPVLWFIFKPLISTALASDIKEAVQEQSQPIKNAFTVLLVRDINKLRRDIARLRFKQTQPEWSADDAQYLADLLIELDSLKMARAALEAKEDDSS